MLHIIFRIECTLADPGSLQWNIALYPCGPVAMLDFVYIKLLAIFVSPAKQKRDIITAFPEASLWRCKLFCV